MTGLECMPVAWHEAPVMKIERPDSRACKTGVIGFGTSSATVEVCPVRHSEITVAAEMRFIAGKRHGRNFPSEANFPLNGLRYFLAACSVFNGPRSSIGG